MKVLCIGDPHFKEDRIKDIEIYVEQVIQLVKSCTFEFVVILGDILHDHERIHTLALNMAYKLIYDISQIVPVYICVGNHDMINCTQFLTDNHWMNGMKHWENVYIADKPISLEFSNDYSFVFVPYVPPGRFQEALNTENIIDVSNITCIFAHQEFKGCKMGAIVSIHGDEWLSESSMIISGHIHTTQRPQINIYYPGSSTQVAFGENSSPVLCIATWDNPLQKFPTIEEIPVMVEKKKLIYTDTNQIQSITLPEEISPEHIKISVSGSIEEFKTFKRTKQYKELITKGIKIVYKPKRIEVKEFNESIETTLKKGFDFKQILYSLVAEKKNPHLIKIYEKVVNNRDICLEDITFV
jgi:DNA repair exonuclease SbcCD nuclease subunit